MHRSAAFAVFGGLLVVRLLAVFSAYFFHFDEVSLATGAVALVRGNGAGFYHYTPQFGYYRLVEGLDLLLGGRVTWVPAIMKALSAIAGAAIPALALVAFPSELTAWQRWLATILLAANPLLWIASQYGNTALVATAFTTAALVLLTRNPGRPGRAFALGLFACGVFVRADNILLVPVLLCLLYRTTRAIRPTLVWGAALGVVILAVYLAVLLFDPMADNAMLAVANHMTTDDDRHFWGFVLWTVSPIPLLCAAWGLRSLAARDRWLLLIVLVWCLPTMLFYAPAATIPRYFLNAMVPLAIAAAVGMSELRVPRVIVVALAAAPLYIGFAYLPWDRGITAPFVGGSAPTQGGEELPTGALIRRTFSNPGVLLWALPRPRFGTTTYYWEAATFPRALGILADPNAPHRTVIVLLSGGWSHAFHYHAEVAGARYLSRQTADTSGRMFGDAWMTIGHSRVQAVTWRPQLYALVTRFEVAVGDEIWVLGGKPFPDGESLQKLPAGLSLAAAESFDPRIRVFRVARAS